MIKNLKLRIWHALYLPQNVANVLSGKKELSGICDNLREAKIVYLIYQYGKSGSSTVYNYLLENGHTAIHCHHLNEQNLQITDALYANRELPSKVTGQRLFSNSRYRAYKACLDGYKPSIKVFVSTRKPETYFKSVFFQQWRLYSSLAKKEFGELTPLSFTAYIEYCLSILDKHSASFSTSMGALELIEDSTFNVGVRCMAHSVRSYMYWFDIELFEVFDLSISDIQYREGRWGFNKNGIEGVIIRLEDFNQQLDSTLSYLVNDTVEIKVQNKNVGAEKPNHEFYAHLQEHMEMPRNLMREIKRSFSYRHFYVGK